MNWTDSLDIAIELDEKMPEIDPNLIRFMDLRNWVLALEGFEGDADRCNEKILEAIQACWIEEKD